MDTSKPMTIGELARRSGVAVKVLREYEGLGFLYTLGRSEGNYRLFDDSALWCVNVVESLRSLGLTLKEVRELTTAYLERPEEPIGPLVAHKLDRALARTERRIKELQAVRKRILDFQAGYARALAGEGDWEVFGPDPRLR